MGVGINKNFRTKEFQMFCINTFMVHIVMLKNQQLEINLTNVVCLNKGVGSGINFSSINATQIVRILGTNKLFQPTRSNQNHIDIEIAWSVCLQRRRQ